MSITGISRQAGSGMCTVSVLGSNKRSVRRLNRAAHLEVRIQFTRTSPSFFQTLLKSRECRCQTHKETTEVLTCTCTGWRPAPLTALIKVCLISEVAAMKSQPRAHLFKRGNNEFFVASHLPITINLAFSTGSCTAIHTVLTSWLSPHTLRCFTRSWFTALSPRGCQLWPGITASPESPAKLLKC